ncbi:hypothetical protein [Sphingobacterium spiritivorum]|uniref:hypothetical protein n=1 Tax=Sphingobacterium spiritivorum TaxID=258 RepID=UPI003DA1FC60
MADYCSNSVEFKGDNTDMVLEHFSAFGKKVPPFIDTAVSGRKVTFGSWWSPPIRDLNTIAERFGVSYHLQYQITGQPKKSLFYVCLDHKPVSPMAERIRDILKGISTWEELQDAQKMVGELLYHRTLDLHDLGVIASALTARSYTIAPSLSAQNLISGTDESRPWESDDATLDRNRQR